MLRILERRALDHETQLTLLRNLQVSSLIQTPVAHPPEDVASVVGAEMIASPDLIEHVATVNIPPILSTSFEQTVPEELPVPPPLAHAFENTGGGSGINWERFLGVNLFAWVGGLALFLGIAFFIKYSFENNLVSPQTRIVCGYLFALGLMGGGLWLSRERHAVTVQTLCATATLILYANTFAAHAYYKFIGPTPAFGLMTLITFTAFLLAVRLDAQVVAVLGLLGGFLTPPMLSTGVDNPLGLFGYLALLDGGLIAVALRKRWHYLVLLAALLTIGMQIGWLGRFFEVQKVYTAMEVFLGFSLLFLAAPVLRRKEALLDGLLSAPAILMPATALGFACFLAFRPYAEIASRAVLILGYVTLVDLFFVALAWLRLELRSIVFVAGGFIFLFFAAWLNQFLHVESLNVALVFVLVFTVLHSVIPIVLHRLKPAPITVNWLHAAPLAGLLLVLLFILKLPAISWVIWPVVLLIDGVALLMAIATAVVWSILGSFALTLIVAAIWIMRIPADAAQVPLLLAVVGGFALFFIVAGVFSARRIFTKQSESGLDTAPAEPILTPELFGQIGSIAAALPFLLLSLVIVQVPLINPSPVFGLALLLLVLLLGVCKIYGADLLVVSGLASVLILEHTWHFMRFQPPQIILAASWYVGFGFLFLLFPFCFRARMQERHWPWIAAAISLPLHFLLLYHGLANGFPEFPYKGLIPAVLAIPCLAGLIAILRKPTEDLPRQQTRLALFGGAALFFITFIFPIQFDRQWITIGWALEGAALLWLFHRVAHPGLRMVGCGLLIASFARLALNPFVITEYSRTGHPLLNWYLYSYTLVAGSLFLGAHLLAPPRDRIDDLRLPPLLFTLGTILTFLLVNIEIADYFSPAGERLTFNFSGRFDQDMAYSLSWGVFAFSMLIIGFKWKNTPVRFSGMGLLVVTLLKLFLHDLWRLGGLYRIGSLIGLAVLLMLISFIYQRFLSSPSAPPGTRTAEPPDFPTSTE